MASPFPGMDPFVETQKWETFHAAFAGDIADALALAVPRHYIAEVQERVYVEYGGERDEIVPDAAVVRPEGSVRGRASSNEAGATVAPIEVLLEMPDERRERYVVIRTPKSGQDVTVIELLSPYNKQPGSRGRRKYLRKLDLVLESDAHLVEIDLLRGGQRCSTTSRAVSGDYVVVVSRADRRPRAEAYTWLIRDSMPRIPIPLLPPDPDAGVDLQDLFRRRHELTRYDDSIDYDEPLKTPLRDEDAAWIAERLRAWRAA